MIAAAYGRGRRETIGLIAFTVTALVVLSVSVASGQHVRAAGATLGVLVLVAIFHEQLLSWRSLVGMTLLTILFVPIRRYSLPASLPFSLEPYRIIVAILIVAWFLTILIDRRVTLRKSRFEAPIFAYLAAIVLSLVTNPSRVNAVGSFPIKTMTFLISYLFVFYIFLSVLRSAVDIDLFVRILVTGGAVLGFFALVEESTRYDVFNHLSVVIPILRYNGSLAPLDLRGGGLRALGSAEHPIAFGAAFAMIIPFAIYRARCSGQARWWIAGILMFLGLFATRSRTGVTMLVAIAIVYLILRPRETRRFWPALLPLVLAIHLAVPGAIGSIRQAFFPKGGLLAQEAKNNVGSGRLATFGPVFHAEFLPNPIFGEGYSTRVVVPTVGVTAPLSPILDDGWLGVLVETGVVGTLALGWLFVRAIRRMGGAARRDDSPRGWLLVAATASVTAYAVGMLTYDSFSFIQVTYFFFFTLAIGAGALHTRPEEWKKIGRTDGVVARPLSSAPTPVEA